MYSFNMLGSFGVAFGIPEGFSFGSLHLALWIPGVYSFSRLGSLEVVCWIPEGFSLDPCTWRFGSLECILLVGLDPWSVFF